MMGFNLSPVVKNLLIANLLLFVLTILIQSQFNIDLNKVLGLYYLKSEYFQPYQLFTHMFMHSGFMHIFFNMLALVMFGPALEQVWGPKRFLLFYMVCGLGAAGLQSGINYYETSQLEEKKIAFVQNPTAENYYFFLKKIDKNVSQSEYDHFKENENNEVYVAQSISAVNEYFEGVSNIPMVGASGAIYGILLGFGMLFPNTILMLLFPPIPIKAKYLVIIYGALELYSVAQSTPGDNIAHFAHLGGMIFGFILIKYWQKRRNSFY